MSAPSRPNGPPRPHRRPRPRARARCEQKVGEDRDEVRERLAGPGLGGDDDVSGGSGPSSARRNAAGTARVCSGVASTNPARRSAARSFGWSSGRRSAKATEASSVASTTDGEGEGAGSSTPRARGVGGGGGGGATRRDEERRSAASTTTTPGGVPCGGGSARASSARRSRDASAPRAAWRRPPMDETRGRGGGAPTEPEARMRAVAMPFAPGPTRAPRDVHPGALARITRSLAVGEGSVGGCDAPLDAL